jgi:hypothetical protein
MTIRGAGIYGGNVAGAGYPVPVPESPRAEPETPQAEVRFTHRCRHCDMLIGRALGIWNDTDGCVVCPDNPASLTAGHQPVCPPSAVADQAVQWDEVKAGDLVIQDGELVIAERVELVAKPWGDGTDRLFADAYWRLGNGVRVCCEHRADSWTAVRRYLTEEG